MAPSKNDKKYHFSHLNGDISKTFLKPKRTTASKKSNKKTTEPWYHKLEKIEELTDDIEIFDEYNGKQKLEKNFNGLFEENLRYETAEKESKTNFDIAGENKKQEEEIRLNNQQIVESCREVLGQGDAPTQKEPLKENPKKIDIRSAVDLLEYYASIL